VPKLLCWSDLHADAVTAGFCRYDDARRAADEVVEFALRERVDQVAYLGDLCDPDTVRSHRAVALAVSVAQRLGDGGIGSMWLTGNHDVIDDGSGSSTLSAIAEVASLVDEPRRANLLGAWCVCLPFVPRCRSYDPAEFVACSAKPEGIAGPTIVLAHLNVAGIAPGSETEDMPRGRDVMLPTAAIAEHLPGAIVISGHYHKRQVWTSPEGVDVHVVGAPERFTFGEQDNEPAFTLVEW
jgi:DNA repair exonuclease SbcCD nuclease subunit